MKEFSKKYLEILTGELAGINLTRITDEDEFYHKQIIDSVLPFEESEVFQSLVEEHRKVIDIGFGGGFPILPLAHKLPHINFLGMEARGKKATAVSKIAEHLELGNVTLMHQRFEEIVFDTPVVITFKAVSTVEKLLSQFITTAPIYVFFYKGPNFRELEDLSSLGDEWEVIEEKLINVKHTDGRLLIGFKKVPRRTCAEAKSQSDLTGALPSRSAEAAAPAERGRRPINFPISKAQRDHLATLSSDKAKASSKKLKDKVEEMTRLSDIF